MTIVFNQEIFIFNFFLSEIFTMMMRYICTSKLLNHIKIILQFVIILKYYSIYGLIFLQHFAVESVVSAKHRKEIEKKDKEIEFLRTSMKKLEVVLI